MTTGSRVVVVTGVAGGIGSATARLLTSHGWKVAGTDLREGPVDGVDRMVVGDASDEGFVLETIAGVVERFGRLDGVVVNAAVQLNQSIQGTSYDEWTKLLKVNLNSSFLWTKYSIPHLERSRGAIVNVSSVHAVATTGKVSAYAATKGGLMAFTRAAALELADHGIRVNAILPGATDTDMLRQGFSRGHLSGRTTDEQVRDLAGRHPLKRIADAGEVAETIYFLLNSDTSAFVTGQGIIVDGGATIKLSTE